MMTCTFKMDRQEVSVRACDMYQARILAMAKYGKQWYHSKLVRISNHN